MTACGNKVTSHACEIHTLYHSWCDLHRVKSHLAKNTRYISYAWFLLMQNVCRDLNSRSVLVIYPVASYPSEGKNSSVPLIHKIWNLTIEPTIGWFMP